MVGYATLRIPSVTTVTHPQLESRFALAANRLSPVTSQSSQLCYGKTGIKTDLHISEDPPDEAIFQKPKQ